MVDQNEQQVEQGMKKEHLQGHLELSKNDIQRVTELGSDAVTSALSSLRTKGKVSIREKGKGSFKYYTLTVVLDAVREALRR